MRPLWDNPPSSYRTEKHLYSNCCLLRFFYLYTLPEHKDAGEFIQITFKQNSFLLTDFYNRFFILFFVILAFLPSLIYYYYIFLRFFLIFLVLWHFRSIPSFLFHNCCVFCSCFYFFAWCFAFTSQNQHTNTIQTDRR